VVLYKEVVFRRRKYLVSNIDYEKLNKHRESTVDDIIKLLENNNKVACVRYTGYGKSYYLVPSLINKLNSKVLILVPNSILKIQYKQIFKDDKNVDVLTYQIIREKTDDYISKHYKDVKYIICDECHHIGNNKWKRELDRFNVIVKAKVIGLTATPLRGDSIEVVDTYFDRVQVEPMELIDGISEGFIPKIKYVVAYAEVENICNYKLSEVDRYSIDKLLNVPIILDKYIDRYRLERNMKILVFVPQVKYIRGAILQCKNWFSSIYPDKSINLYNVSSKNSKSQNERQLNNFRKEHSSNIIDIMVSVDMLIEGLHLPTISVEIMLRKTKSPVTYFQQICRVINAEQPIIFDLINNSSQIYQIGREYSLNRETFNVKRRKRKVMFEDCIELYDETKDITNILKKYAYFKSYNKVPTELKELVIKEDKLTHKQIAEKYNIAVATVEKIFKEYGITRNESNTVEGKLKLEKVFNDNLEYIKSCNGNKSRRQVAEELDMTEGNLKTLLKNNNIKWNRVYPSVIKSQKLKEEFVDLMNKKCSPKEIKEKLNLTDKEYGAYLRDDYVIANRKLIKGVLNDFKKSAYEYIKENSGKMSLNQLAKNTGLSASTIGKYIRENNLTPFMIRKKPLVITEELENKVLDLYKDLGSLYGVHKELGIHKNTVKKIVLKHGLKIKSSSVKPKKTKMIISFK
jgi:superfamily II DNA or RNA helicase